MPHIWPPFVTRRIDIVLFFFFFLETEEEEEMTCILFVVGPGIIYSRPVLKIFLLLLLLLARTYGCTLLGENLFSSATCARRHVFFCLLALFCSSTHCWLAVRQMETINSSRFYCRRAAPRYGEIAGTVYDPFLLRFFSLSLDDDGDLFVNKRASKCVRTASSWLALRFFCLLCFKRKSSEKSSTRCI